MRLLHVTSHKLRHWFRLPTVAAATRIALLTWARRLTSLLVFPLPLVFIVAFFGFGGYRQTWLYLLPSLISLIALHIALKAWQDSARRQFIRDTDFPDQLNAKLVKKYQHITPAQAELVLHGLRQFFMANARCNGMYVAMPSRAVDAAWHEFILHTRRYGQWCDLAFGNLLHHTPASAMGTSAKRNDGLRRAWYWACKEEGIDPGRPVRLPLLFALDKKLDIKNGFCYIPDCKTVDRALAASTTRSGSESFCGTAFSDGSYSSNSSSSDSFGGADGNSSDGAGSGGGSSSDGGGGDGGGGCGGGGGD